MFRDTVYYSAQHGSKMNVKADVNTTVNTLQCNVEAVKDTYAPRTVCRGSRTWLVAS